MNKGLVHHIIFVMGVSGSGKSSIGRLLAQELSMPFIDADDHHPTSNIEKMSQGKPLNDKDRIPWLDQLNTIAKNHLNSGCVIACSALKESYRVRLNQNLKTQVLWIYLKGDYNTIFERMNNRKDHFMDPNLLQSQFDTLEEPLDALVMNIAKTPEQIVEDIKKSLNKS